MKGYTLRTLRLAAATYRWGIVSKSSSSWSWGTAADDFGFEGTLVGGAALAPGAAAAGLPVAAFARGRLAAGVASENTEKNPQRTAAIATAFIANRFADRGALAKGCDTCQKVWSGHDNARGKNPELDDTVHDAFRKTPISISL